MKNIKLIYLLSIIFSFALCHPLFSQNIYKGNYKVISNVLWNVDSSSKTLHCVVIDSDSTDNYMKTFNFYNENYDSVIYSFQDDEYPLSIYPLNDGSENLMIVSNSATATVFSVFSYLNGKISLVLESGSKFGPPELIYENQVDGCYIIIVTNIGWAPKQNGNGEKEIAQSANIYRWQKDRYIEVPNVPWSKRLNWKK
jgi:hypothetical protein